MTDEEIAFKIEALRDEITESCSLNHPESGTYDSRGEWYMEMLSLIRVLFERQRAVEERHAVEDDERHSEEAERIWSGE